MKPGPFSSSVPPAAASALQRRPPRNIRRSAMVACLFFFAAIAGSALPARGEDDLRERFGTRSMEAAKLIQEGMQKMNAKEIPDALKIFEKASAVDPDCTFATYWMATAASDLGDIERSISLYKSIVERGLRSGPSLIAVDSAINLGLTYGRLGDDGNATHSFSQAILIDPKDKIKLAYKAYRNMAIAFTKRKQPLSAAICAIKAYEANPKAVSDQFVIAMLDAVGTEEVGTPLNFEKSGEPPKPRKDPIKARALAIAGVDDEIVDIQVDPAQDRVFAFGKERRYYYLFEGKAPELAVKIPVDGAIVSACANAGNLYLMLQSPAGLAKVDPATGKIEKQWPLKAPAPSVAVYPIQKQAFFPIGGTLQKLNLQTSELSPTDHLATRVRVDPRQRFCFSDIHPGFREEGGHMIINGRPIFFQRTDMDWAQTSLVRYAIADDELLVSSFRLNAAANGRALHVSPDGKWVTAIGGGGWRPGNPEGKAGYGVAVFSTDDLGHLQGFFATDAYPHGAAVNPVAGIVAAFNEKKVRMYDLAAPGEHVELPGSFGNAAAWDAGGLTLYVAGKKPGILAFQIDRSEGETQLATTWAASMKKTWPAGAEAPRELTTTAVAEFEKYAPAATKEEVIALIKSAIRDGRTTKPIQYEDYAPYTSGATKRADLLEAFGLIKSGDTGVAIFKVRKLLEADPKNPGLLLTLGIGYFQTGQLDKAQASQLDAIRLDAGRTSASIEALRNLARIHKRKQEILPAAQCFAAILLLDKVNPERSREAVSFFTEAGLLDEAKPLLDASATMRAPSEAAPAGMPKLLVPAPSADLDSVKLFASTVSSVVLVKTSSGSGSGVCIAEGVLLTNHHVVAGAGSAVSVHPFVLVEGKLQRLDPKKASVLYSDEARDIALLAIENPPPSLKPLALATGNPQTGARVYALGSPGLGREVLEQSITEGIVSSVERELGGQPFLQHTAAVNPGNSGGPLFNAQGHVVGINTTKPALENVSFAIPATAIRKLLEGK